MATVAGRRQTRAEPQQHKLCPEYPVRYYAGSREVLTPMTTFASDRPSESNGVRSRAEHQEPGSLYRTADVAPPQVFVSSTLGPQRVSRIRERLGTDLTNVGYRPLMSESGKFIYTGGSAKVYDDTIAAVAASQVFVLLIGRRYGSLHPESNSSITEMEYDAARRDGLPSVVFVDAEVKEGWDIWRAGSMRDADIPRWVDDVRVWRFMDKVMTDDACPVFPFEDAGSVVETLHGQLANFFGALLRFDHGARRWLWTAERTGKFETRATAVWVLTPDLYWDFQDDQYRELVHQNVVARKIPYRYLYSQSARNSDRVEELQAAYVDALGAAEAAATAKFAPIPEEEFLWCTEHVLFNAGTPREAGLVVDICEDRDRSRKYDVLMGRSKRQAFRRHFLQLWANYSDEAIVPAQ
jgi:hypothetical protein